MNAVFFSLLLSSYYFDNADKYRTNTLIIDFEQDLLLIKHSYRGLSVIKGISVAILVLIFN